MEYIVHNGMMKDLSVLQEPPFTDQGSIVEVFTDLTLWAGIKGVIDRINANAAAYQQLKDAGVVNSVEEFLRLVRPDDVLNVQKEDPD